MIVCCGESLIDMLPTPLLPSQAQQENQTKPFNQVSVTGFKPVAGGAIFNTAISLGRLGEATALVSGVSTDMFGEQLEQSLTDSHVNSDYLIRSAQPTTLAFVQLTNGHASYSFFDENSAGNTITHAQLPALDSQVRCLYFGGISLIAQPAADAYAHMAVTYAADKVIMVDPNIRPSFITDETAYRARLQTLFACADVIKVSDEDLAWLVVDATDEKKQVEALMTPVTRLVIVTHGEDGVVGYLADTDNAKDGLQILTHAAEKATVADTVGAGDTFNAGFLASLSQQGVLSKAHIQQLQPAQVQQAFALAAKVAAITVSRTGANPPWLSEL